MARWKKIVLRTAIGLFALIVTLYCGAAFYINQNNKKILASILTQLNAKVNGQVKVEKMETTLFGGFPGVSVLLKKALLRDSLWSRHQHDLLNASDIEVSLNALSLLRGNINIRKIGINNAQIYIYTDSNGYSNTSMFKTKAEKKAEKNQQSTPFQIRKIDFNQVKLVVENQRRHKQFSFRIDKLKGKVDYPFSGWEANLQLKTKINTFAFNTNKGSFLKDKYLEGNLTARYHENTQVITIDPKPLMIDKDEYFIGAKIDLSKNDSSFGIDIKANQVLYANIARNLAPNISSKLLRFKIEKPVDVEGHIVDNGDRTQKDPKINVMMVVKNNRVSIPSGNLDNASFVGTFTNKDTLAKAIGDENSVIKFYNIKADYYGAPIRVDTFTVGNLARPVATGLVKSSFDLSQLNQSIGGDDYEFNNGKASLSLYCKADIDNFKLTKPDLVGDIDIKNADILYKPRNMRLTKSSLKLRFNQKDLNITSSNFEMGHSVLKVDLAIQNFLNFYYTAPEKVVAHLNIYSPNLAIGELMPFLSPRKTKIKKRPAPNSLREISNQLSDVLEAAHIKIGLKVKKASYKHFIAQNLDANIDLKGTDITFRRISLNHAGGKISFKGGIQQLGAINKFTLTSNINQVSVKEFFYSFDNFGQQSITHKNLKGVLTAIATTKGSITPSGNIIKRSMYGKVDFTLNKAALLNFEPLQRVQKFAFANRDFSNITIQKVNGTLTLSGDKVYISPMQFNTSVLNFDIQGVYGLDKGTNIAMDIPLRNPKKNEGITDKDELATARMKGIVLHLKAIDDEKGGIKIRWNGNRK